MAEKFWDTIMAYNASTWGIQLLIYIVGAVLLFLIYKKPNKIIINIFKAYLAFCFGWIAVVFFFINGSQELNKYSTGAFFGVIALLWIIDIFLNKVKFERDKKYDIIAVPLYLLFLFYPIFSLLLQKQFPAICTYLMPCPLTVFAITVLIAFSKSTDYKILTLLLVWALTGLPKLFMFNVPEDIILFAAGILELVVFIPKIIKSRKSHKIQIQQ